MRLSFLKIFGLIILISFFSLSCTQKNKKEKAERVKEVPTYTIGVNLALSGGGSYLAEEVRKGLELSFDFVNDSSDKLSLDVIYEDNKLSPKDAVSITRKFLEVDDVDLVICGYTPLIQATIGLVNEYETPMIATLTSAENIATPYDWAFRDFEMESDIMPMMATYAYDGLDFRKGSYLVVNDDMGRDAVKYFFETFESLGGEMLEGSSFETSDMDFRNKINKVMDGDPQFILVAGRGSSMINACRQIRERYPELPIFGNNTIDNDMVWDALGESGNLFWFPRPFADLENKRYVRANQRFKDRHGYDINWLNLYGISMGNYVARGLQKSGGDKEAMKNYLKNLNVQSIRGNLVMNENRDVQISHMVCQRKDGENIVVEINE
jgi:ABC-type branched-subunit amino acid transport system substrate-binding protein